MSCIIFVGAGASKSFDIPTGGKAAESPMRELVDEFRKHLLILYSSIDFSRYKEKEELGDELKLYDDILKHLGEGYPQLDIEAIFSVLNDLSYENGYASRLYHPTVLYILNDSYQMSSIKSWMSLNLKKKQEIAKRLKIKLEQFYLDKLYPHENKKSEIVKLYEDFFTVILAKHGHHLNEVRDGNNRVFGNYCTIFTTNNDPCIEIYCKAKNMQYVNGQLSDGVLDLTKRGNKELFEGSKCRILKLHGSVNWYYKDGRMKYAPIDEEIKIDPKKIQGHLLVYPAQEKFMHQDPFLDMFVFLRDTLFMAQEWFIIGYSFSDREIKDFFVNAYQQRKKEGRTPGVYIIDPNPNIKDKLKEIDDIKVITNTFNENAIQELKEKIDSK